MPFCLSRAPLPSFWRCRQTMQTTTKATMQTTIQTTKQSRRQTCPPVLSSPAVRRGIQFCIRTLEAVLCKVRAVLILSLCGAAANTLLLLTRMRTNTYRVSHAHRSPTHRRVVGGDMTDRACGTWNCVNCCTTRRASCAILCVVRDWGKMCTLCTFLSFFSPSSRFLGSRKSMSLARSMCDNGVAAHDNNGITFTCMLPASKPTPLTPCLSPSLHPSITLYLPLCVSLLSSPPTISPPPPSPCRSLSLPLPCDPTGFRV